MEEAVLPFEHRRWAGDASLGQEQALEAELAATADVQSLGHGTFDEELEQSRAGGARDSHRVDQDVLRSAGCFGGANHGAKGRIGTGAVKASLVFDGAGGGGADAA